MPRRCAIAVRRDRSVGLSLSRGEGVAHASGTYSRLHRVRVADGDTRDRHVAGEELGQGLYARPRSTIERIAHGPRVRILAVPQAAEAHRVLASGRFLLLHLRRRRGKAIPLALYTLLSLSFVLRARARRDGVYRVAESVAVKEREKSPENPEKDGEGTLRR